MSTERDTGGPAFPVPAVYDHAREQVNSSSAYSGEGGMTLRDYFAAKAMHALICDPDLSQVYEHIDTPDEDRELKFLAARNAYRWADAMLKARQA